MFTELLEQYEKVELQGLTENKAHQARVAFAEWLDRQICPACSGRRVIRVGIYTEECGICEGTGFRPTPREPDKRDSEPPIYIFSVRDLSTKKGLS